MIQLFLVGCHRVDTDPSLSSNYPNHDTQEPSNQALELADSLHSLLLYDSANYFYDQGNQELIEQSEWILVVRNLNNWGFNLMEMGAGDIALSRIEQAREIATKWLPQEAPEWAGIRFNQGLYASQSGQSDSALYYLEQALDIDRNSGPDEITVFRAHILHRIGDIYRYSLQDFRRAEKFYQRALAIREKVLPGNHYDLLVSYYALASIYRNFDDHRRAEIFAENALQIAHKLKGDNTQPLSFCYNLVANILYEKAKLGADTADFLRAIKQYGQAIDLMEDRKDPALGYYYNNLGETYQQLAEVTTPESENYQQQALNYYHRSLRFKRPLGDPLEIADSYLTLGWGHTAGGNFDSANFYYSRCLAIRKDLLPAHSPSLAEVHLDLGRMYEKFDLLGQGVIHYQKAIEVLQPKDKVGVDQASSNLEILFRSMIDNARILTKRFHRNGNIEDLKQALALYNQADHINNEHRNVNIYDEAKLYFQNYYKADFERAMEACYQLYKQTDSSEYLNQAFRFMEKDKYMLLFESLTKSTLVTEFGVPDSILQLERKLTSRMSELQQQQQQMDPETESPEELEELNIELLQVNRDLERLKDDINRLYPGYYQIQYDSLSKSISSIQASLKPVEMLINFYWGQEAVYALGATRENMTLNKILIDEALETHIDTYLKVLGEEKGVSDKVGEFSAFTESSYHIFKIFIEPLVSAEMVDKLIIVPDGELSHIPVESLLTKPWQDGKPDYRNLPYLIKEYRVQYAYNTNLLWHHHGTNRQAPSILALNHSGLQGSTEEIEALKSTLSTTVLTGSKASEHNFKLRAKEYDILHLAVHGVGGRESSAGSKLVFNEGEDSPEDGELNAYELYNLELAADLAVLSACETGMGKELAGEGIYSMARAFSYAGCPSIIMSLWKIDDRQSASIFKTFYQQIKEGYSSSQALHVAKLKFLESQDEITAHPSAWAALVSIGDSQWPASPDYSSKYWWLLIGMVALVFVIIGLRQLYYRNQPFFR